MSLTQERIREVGGKLQELASEFEEAEVETTLQGALRQMVKDGERALVGVIREAITRFNGFEGGPQPWPGALRDDIDYTADDFPMLYQPPPGFDWVASNRPDRAVPYQEAVQIPAAEAAEKRTMVLDNRGRVKWTATNGGDYSSGFRWRVWHIERDGIPRVFGFADANTPPVAMDAEGGPRSVWRSEDDFVVAQRRVREISEAYGAPGTVNEFGVAYEPATAALEVDSSFSTTEELRVGDLLSAFGRVLRVTRQDASNYRIETDGCEGNSDYVGRFNEWQVRRVVGWESQPTALSISMDGAPQPMIDYDPLSIPVKSAGTYVSAFELRLGDDIVGEGFGRVVAVRADMSIEMDRDGEQNTYVPGGDGTYYVLPIDVPDRDAIPTAISFAKDVATDGPVVRLSYDPRTIAVARESKRIRVDELRLGDSVPGFGRVVDAKSGGRNDVVIVTYKPNAGVTAEREWRFSQTWNVYPVVGLNRAFLPPAVSLVDQTVVVEEIPF